MYLYINPFGRLIPPIARDFQTSSSLCMKWSPIAQLAKGQPSDAGGPGFESQTGRVS